MLLAGLGFSSFQSSCLPSWYDNVLCCWLGWDSLRFNLLACLLGLDLSLIVGLNSLDESESASGFSHMLNTNVDSLLDESSINALVDNDTDGMGSHVENTTSLTVIEFVWHTLVDRTISEHIDVVTDLVYDEVFREWSSSMLLVWL